MTHKFASFASWLQRPTSIVPLVAFRVAFGLLMFASSVRFLLNGWVEQLYIAPEFHFTYLGFEWVQPLEGGGMYLVFGALALLSLLIAAGFAYRVVMVLYFLVFTYVELIDKATYLNHYYFISLLSFLLIFLPLHRNYSVDAWLRPQMRRTHVPFWVVFLIRLQLGLVYFFAGFAKLNPDWMLDGLPLAIWLKGNTSFPLIGSLFDYGWVALAMSWAGAFYDLTIPFWLSWRRSRPLAYLSVIAFHIMTAMLFQIGMFPWIMMTATLIFFSEEDYRWLLASLSRTLPFLRRLVQDIRHVPPQRTPAVSRLLVLLFVAFFAFQVVMPLRHYLYPGDTNWTMEGYRFAWRVMLNEKTGHTTFYLRDPQSGRQWIVYGREILTEQQARNMSYQPDMILEFAHYLEERYRDEAGADLEITVEAYVTHNGRSSRLLVDPTVDLTQIERSLLPSPWILH